MATSIAFSQAKVEGYDEKIKSATIELNLNKEAAGGLAENISDAGEKTNKISSGVEKAQKFFKTFQSMLLRTFIRAAAMMYIFKAIQSVISYISSAIKTNPEAVAAIARLKGALLTMAQPLIQYIIPAFTRFATLLANIVTEIAKFVAMIFGTTVTASATSAKALNGEIDALDGVSSAADGVADSAKEATKALAPFDEIQQLTANNTEGTGSGGSSSSSGIAPDFSGIGDNDNWLEKTLGKAAGWVTAGLLLGGLALIAIGAATGNILSVIAGLALLAAGVYVGTETGTLQSWVDTLGLNSVEEFLVIGLFLGGLALTAIGAMMANIGMVIAGLALLGSGIFVAEKTGVMQNWADTLGLSKVASWVTAGLLLGGMALIVFGIIKADILMVLAGIGVLAAGVYVGVKSGTFKKWWDILNLPQVAGWVATGLLVGGLALTVIGICTSNILMIIGGLVMLGAGIAFGITSGTFKKWWDVLCLPQVAGWVETALLLGGIGLLVIGIATGNLPMLLFGLGLLGAAITFGITSGTFSRWIDDIKEGLKNGWNDIKDWWNSDVAPIFTTDWWKSKFDTIKEALVQKVKDAVNGGITLFNQFIDWVNDKMKFSWDPIVIGGVTLKEGGSIQLFTIPHIPYLASGAVIPPNQAFLSVLGDQKSGNNIEAPESLIRKIVREESGGSGAKSITVIMECDKRVFGRVVYDLNNDETQRVGVKLA